MVQLPRYVALKSKNNNSYLRYVNEDSEVKTFLQYSGDDIFTPYTKYELQTAKCDPSMVNIRCCYNNKYWCSWSSDPGFIIAGADKAEEDKSKWTCTLFQPFYDRANQAYRFRHVYRGFNVCLWRVGPPYGNCLRAQWSDPDTDLCDLSTITDWETLIPLPKHVAFKGDNGLFVQASTVGGNQILQFGTSDIGNPAVPMETFVTNDGSVRIKSDYFGKFWRRLPDYGSYIFSDSTDTTATNPDTLFWPTQLNKNVIALRNLGNSNFIKRMTSSRPDIQNGLNAAVSTIDQYSQLQISEAVISREIYDVRFRPADGRIYDQSILAMATGNATNRTEVPNTITMSLKYTDTKSSTWNASVSLKLGVKTSIQTGVPFIADGKIEISAEFTGSYAWGETQTTSKELGTLYQVTVPPMTSIIVSLLATKGTCDVPYSYTQRDVLTNGKTATYYLDDGVYNGINCYNFTYETKKIPISCKK